MITTEETLEKDYDNRKIVTAAVRLSVGRLRLGCVWRHAATASASLRWRTVLAASAMPLPDSDGVQQCG